MMIKTKVVIHNYQEKTIHIIGFMMNNKKIINILNLKQIQIKNQINHRFFLQAAVVNLLNTPLVDLEAVIKKKVSVYRNSIIIHLLQFFKRAKILIKIQFKRMIIS